MKRFFLIILSVILILPLAACSAVGDVQDTNMSPGGVEAFDFNPDTHTFLPESFDITADSPMLGSSIRDNRVFRFNMEFDYPAPPRLVLTSTLPDGSDLRQTGVDLEHGTYVWGAFITEENHIGIIAVESNIVYYAEHGMDGRMLLRQDFDGLDTQEPSITGIEHTFFTANGEIIIAAWTSFGYILYAFDKDSGAVAYRQISAMPYSIAGLHGGGTVAVYRIHENTVMREIDTATAGFGEPVAITKPNVHFVFPVANSAHFDFLLIDDNLNGFGYCSCTGLQTALFNWLEAGMPGFSGIHVDFLSDGRIAIIREVWDGGNWNASLTILTPSLRDAST